MAYEVKPNTGSLFRNTKKETDSHPDYNGNGVIDGTEYWFSAWINEAKDGSKYMSLKFKPKDAPRQTASQAYAGAEQFNDDSDVPF